MRKIEKGQEPDSLCKWKRRHPRGSYKEIEDGVRQDIRKACVAEQFYLCAYCCQRISGDYDTCNEHVEARNSAPNLSLDFGNIVASCRTKHQCDSSHGSHPLPLTPLMAECESEFRFMMSGRVEGLTDRANKSIRVLNLGDHEKNNRKLIEKRKQLSHSLLRVYGYGIDPNDELDDDELLRLVINDLKTPRDGKLESFAPVVANILEGWLA